MTKNKPCKICGGKGLAILTENGFRALSPCPDCQQPEQKECEHKWIMLDEIVQCCKCQIPKPDPQPTDGLIDWGEKELESFFVAYSCYYSNSTPKTYEFNQKNKEKVKKQASNFIRQLLTEQKLKTKEDALNNIEAIWTRLMNETDDPVKKEVYANCIRALKI